MWCVSMEWANDEGWNPANTDRLAFHAMDPGAFLMGRLDGEPVACISVRATARASASSAATSRGRSVRGKGYGIQIWNAGMKRLAGRNVGLDGVAAQQANYRKSGFRVLEQCPARRHAPARGTGRRRASAGRCAELAVRQARGLRPPLLPEARDSFLAPWITAARAHGAGGAEGRRDRGLRRDPRAVAGASRIGPLYAAVDRDRRGVDDGARRGRCRAGRSRSTCRIQRGAVTWLAGQLGLKPAFETARMYTGADPAIDRAGLFGVASLELG